MATVIFRGTRMKDSTPKPKGLTLKEWKQMGCPPLDGHGRPKNIPPVPLFNKDNSSGKKESVSNSEPPNGDKAMTAQETVIAIPNGEFTIHNPTTGNHRTFRIKTARNGNLKGKRIVSLLTGNDNTSDYKGFAFVYDDKIVVWQKYRGDGPWESYATLLWSMIVKGSESPYAQKGATIKESRHCARCNRLLTEPESIDRGLGPECFGKGLL